MSLWPCSCPDPACKDRCLWHEGKGSYHDRMMNRINQTQLLLDMLPDKKDFPFNFPSGGVSCAENIGQISSVFLMNDLLLSKIQTFQTNIELIMQTDFQKQSNSFLISCLERIKKLEAVVDEQRETVVRQQSQIFNLTNRHPSEQVDRTGEIKALQAEIESLKKSNAALRGVISRNQKPKRRKKPAAKPKLD